MLLASILVLRDITERKRVETELTEAKILLEKTFASLDQAVFVVGTKSRTILACNPAVERIFGYTEKELIGQSTEFMYVDRFAYEQYPQKLNESLNSTGAYHTELQMRRKDGGIFPVEITETSLLDGAGNRIGVVSVVRDITERKRIEEALLASESKFRSLVEQSPYGILVVDELGNILEWNTGQEEISGLLRSDVLGRPVWDVQFQIMPDEFKSSYNHTVMMESTLDILKYGRGPDLNQPMETEIQLPNGTRRNIEIVMYSYKTTNGYQLGSITRDVTERKLAEIRMEYLATHDELTDLPNRYLYRDRLKLAIERARRVRNDRPVNGEVLIAVMLLDLDNFKFINDSFGHDEGDRVLKIVAARLNDSVRKTDTIARMGGDEFVLIHENLASIEDVMQVARKILANLSEPVRMASFEHQITASVGISLYPMDGEDDVTLLKQADIAMYRAKRTRNNFEFYQLPEI
jgi:diguanylate cyclase (GGDEF)-like protein/PAS domain S-box-containing protein